MQNLEFRIGEWKNLNITCFPKVFTDELLSPICTSKNSDWLKIPFRYYTHICLSDTRRVTLRMFELKSKIVTQPLELKLDPGSKITGIALVCNDSVIGLSRSNRIA